MGYRCVYFPSRPPNKCHGNLFNGYGKCFSPLLCQPRRFVISINHCPTTNDWLNRLLCTFSLYPNHLPICFKMFSGCSKIAIVRNKCDVVNKTKIVIYPYRVEKSRLVHFYFTTCCPEKVHFSKPQQVVKLLKAS